MLDFGTKQDNANAPAGQLTAAEFNNYIDELENSVTRSGQTLDSSGVNVIQLAKAIGCAGRYRNLIDGDTAVVGDIIAVNNDSNSVTIKLPVLVDLFVGALVQFRPTPGQPYATHNLIVGRNGQTINGISADITVSTTNANMDFRWNGATWVSNFTGTAESDGSSVSNPLSAVTFLTITSSASYVPGVNVKYAIVECIGGGGGSGGCRASTDSNIENGAGSGGAGGSYSRSVLVPAASTTVTIGAGGAAGIGSTNISAGNGGTTSFGTLVTAPGGGGGFTDIGSSFPHIVNGGFPGNTGVGDVSVPGGTGHFSIAGAGATLLMIIGGEGGNSALSGGAGSSIGDGSGVSPTGFGGGAGGSRASNTNASFNGAIGAPGIVIITEFS